MDSPPAIQAPGVVKLGVVNRLITWDPYQALGVARTASADEIRKAHRKLAKELHPDVRPNDARSAERFQRATAAYSLLSDSKKRARFDRGEIDADGNERGFHGFRSDGYGTDDLRRGQGGRTGEWPGGYSDPFQNPGGPHTRRRSGDSGDDGISDLFSEIFGGSSRKNGTRRGADIRVAVEIEFLDSVSGTRRRVQLPGHRPLEITIPPGVETGQVLRLRGQGEPGPSGAGDALVEIHVREDMRYRRKGDDVYVDVGISLREAVEGGKVTLESPGGTVALTIPPGSNSGKLLRLRGKGVQKEGQPGDLMVRLIVMLPEPGVAGPDSELQTFVRGWSKASEPPDRIV